MMVLLRATAGGDRFSVGMDTVSGVKTSPPYEDGIASKAFDRVRRLRGFRVSR
jgi:hypothetical protein